MTPPAQLGPGSDAVLFTRAWPNRSIIAEFDEWQERRHFPDLVALPGVDRADYYRTVVDDVPQVFQGTGNRIAMYWGADMRSLLGFVTHPGVAAAVEDGSQYFPHFNELDGDTYTGNLYELGPLRSSATELHDGHLALFVERYEITAEHAQRFERWFVEEHEPGLLAAASVVALRTGTAVRNDLPIPYYNSPGNAVVLALVDPDIAVTTTDEAFLAVLAHAQAWDRQLGYVRRELATFAFRGERSAGIPTGVNVRRSIVDVP